MLQANYIYEVTWYNYKYYALKGDKSNTEKTAFKDKSYPF